MRTGKCAWCPHREYLHDDRVTPTGRCMVEGCHEHIFEESNDRPRRRL